MRRSHPRPAFDPMESAEREIPLFDPATQRPGSRIAGATVRAPSCMVADALTKIVMISGEARGGILKPITRARCSCRRPGMFASRRNGKMSSALQLDRRLRWSLYAAFALLFATGAAWLLADHLKDSPRRILASHDRQRAHGPWRGGDVDALAAGRAISHSHRAAWRSRRNRLAGAAMVIANVLFVATAFGLYYAGSDTWRPWISDVHIAVGVVFPVLIVIHVWTGRRMLPIAEKESPR